MNVSLAIIVALMGAISTSAILKPEPGRTESYLMATKKWLKLRFYV